MSRRPDPWDLWNSRLKNIGLTVMGLYGGYAELNREGEVRWPAVAIIGLFLGLPVANLLDGLVRGIRSNGNAPVTSPEDPVP